MDIHPEVELLLNTTSDYPTGPPGASILRDMKATSNAYCLGSPPHFPWSPTKAFFHSSGLQGKENTPNWRQKDSLGLKVSRSHSLRQLTPIAILLLIFWGNSTLLPIVVAPFHIATTCAQRFQLLCLLLNTHDFLFLTVTLQMGVRAPSQYLFLEQDEGKQLNWFRTSVLFSSSLELSRSVLYRDQIRSWKNESLSMGKNSHLSKRSWKDYRSGCGVRFSCVQSSNVVSVPC
jgi:hypothetical protein